MNENQEIVLLLGELKGKMESMERGLADHRGESTAGIARLEGAMTVRFNNHAERLSKLEHSRTRVVSVLSFVVGTLTIAGSYIGFFLDKKP